MQEQFDLNIKVRDLVSDVNKMAAKLRGNPKLAELASHVITPAIRYSKPELQTHIAYLYTLTNGADQRPGRDAMERYEILRKELDVRIAELNKLVGNE